MVNTMLKLMHTRLDKRFNERKIKEKAIDIGGVVVYNINVAGEENNHWLFNLICMCACSSAG